MKLWLLERSKNSKTGWDEYLGFVIAASTPDRARAMASEKAGEGWWLDAKQTTVEYVGEAAFPEDRIILDSFRAGRWLCSPRAKMRRKPSADLANFDHGDSVGIVGRVFKAEWWMVWRWIAWLFYRCTARSRWVTFTTGERMRLVATQHKSKDKGDDNAG